VIRRNVVVHILQKFTRISVSTVEISGGKLDVRVITETRYLSQNVFGVFMKRLVMTDEVVVDVTWLTEIILRPPMGIEMLLPPLSLLQNVLNELLEFHFVSGRHRPRNHIISAMILSYAVRTTAQKA